MDQLFGPIIERLVSDSATDRMLGPVLDTNGMITGCIYRQLAAVLAGEGALQA